MPAENKPSKRICTYRIQKFSMRLKDEPIDVTLPTSSNAPVLTPEDEAAHSKARSDAVKVRCRTAWSLNRWPLDFQRRIMSARTRVHLPREFKGVGGQDVKVIYEGQELNGFIHEWYSVAEGSEDKGNEQEAKDEAKRKRRNKVNYVTADGISARRHEFLGPDPRVAGYWLDDAGEVHICWFDGFLQEEWMDNGRWRGMEVEKGVDGKWVEKGQQW